MSVLLGSANLGVSMPYIDCFSHARGAAALIFHIIDREPEIDVFSEEGKKSVRGSAASIEFKDVHFSYPSRPTVNVRDSFLNPNQFRTEMHLV
jgi:ATP-binding cassette subfamily B (MDR/TAP) protein 1